MKEIRDGKKMVWSDKLMFPMTVAFDSESNRVVVFNAAGKNLEGKEGIMMPISESNPFKIPDMYGASVAAMAQVIIQESAKEFFKELSKMLDIDMDE